MRLNEQELSVAPVCFKEIVKQNRGRVEQNEVARIISQQAMNNETVNNYSETVLVSGK